MMCQGKGGWGESHSWCIQLTLEIRGSLDPRPGVIFAVVHKLVVTQHSVCNDTKHEPRN